MRDELKQAANEAEQEQSLSVLKHLQSVSSSVIC